jgi:hypothetical protein
MQESAKASESRFVRFCVLEYRAQGLGKVAPVFLFVLEDAEGSLRFLIRKDWRSIVRPEDAGYVNNVLVDSLERASEEPEPLFKQICSLGVGPLVTSVTGDRLSEYPHLLELSSRFVPL